MMAVPLAILFIIGFIMWVIIGMMIALVGTVLSPFRALARWWFDATEV